MAKRLKLTPEQLELKRDEYNQLKIKEEDLLAQYSRAKYINRISLAKKLKDIALKILVLEHLIDKNSC